MDKIKIVKREVIKIETFVICPVCNTESNQRLWTTCFDDETEKPRTHLCPACREWINA